jgi:hypothetical protein
MVTAILPTMTYESHSKDSARTREIQNGTNHTTTPSISSELTITPARFHARSPQNAAQIKQINKDGASIDQLAGLVGMFSGLGALLALFLFLPLPTRFEAYQSPSMALANSYYTVGSIAFCVGLGCFIGLRNLPGESNKSIWKLVWLPGSTAVQAGSVEDETSERHLTYFALAIHSLRLAGRDSRIFLAFLGGFVARSSSVAISLFIPLFCNAYFTSTGQCPISTDPHEILPPELKSSCHRAYVLASILSGTSQLVALVCAPFFGYLSSRARFGLNLPLVAASICGIVGYASFALLKSPDPRSSDGTIAVYFIVALLGLSQIGSIVCSLGLLGRAINDNDEDEGSRTGKRPVNQSNSGADK